MSCTIKILFKLVFLLVSVTIGAGKTRNRRGFFYWIYRVSEQNHCTMLLTKHQSTKVCREIPIFKIFFPWRQLDNTSRNSPRIFLVTPTLDADIETTNQNIENGRDSFVDWCLVNNTVKSFCSCCGIQYPINSIEEPLAVSRLNGSWH